MEIKYAKSGILTTLIKNNQTSPSVILSIPHIPQVLLFFWQKKGKGLESINPNCSLTQKRLNYLDQKLKG